MRSLELAWSRPYISPRGTQITSSISAKEGVDFLAVIRDTDVQLKELVLTDWFFVTNWNHRSKLLHALAHFLR